MPSPEMDWDLPKFNLNWGYFGEGELIHTKLPNDQVNPFLTNTKTHGGGDSEQVLSITKSKEEETLLG